MSDKSKQRVEYKYGKRYRVLFFYSLTEECVMREIGTKSIYNLYKFWGSNKYHNPS